jgi:hypothetical protein
VCSERECLCPEGAVRFVGWGGKVGGVGRTKMKAVANSIGTHTTWIAIFVCRAC